MTAPLDILESRQRWSPVLLAIALWREARGTGETGMTAVAYSIMERVEHPTWWGHTLAEVLAKKWQYSSLAAPGDPQLILWPVDEDVSWRLAMAVADAVLAKSVANPVPAADSYFDASIPPPKWATPERFIGKVGRLSFYRVRT